MAEKDQSEKLTDVNLEHYYFSCYDSLEIHNAMMRDRQRMNFYYDCIRGNSHLFKDKVVLEVGCGLGVLSVFAAQAGAKRVIATEAAVEAAEIAKETFTRNRVRRLVEVHAGKIEDLPLDIDRVDIIISEWMGYCLLYEQMLPSVLFARDKYKPAIMVPNLASILMCGFGDEEYYKDRTEWTKEEAFGFNLTSAKNEICRTIWTYQCDSSQVATTVAEVASLDLNKIPLDECTTVAKTNFQLKLLKPFLGNVLYGLVFFFEAQFSHGGGVRPTLTTSPHGYPTHWLQSVCLFEEPMHVLMESKVSGTFEMHRHKSSPRGIQINVKFDPKGLDSNLKLDYTFSKA